MPRPWTASTPEVRDELRGRLTRLPLAIVATALLLRGANAWSRETTLVAVICLIVGLADLLALVVLARASGRSASSFLAASGIAAGIVAALDSATSGGRAIWIALALLCFVAAALTARRSAPITKT